MEDLVTTSGFVAKLWQHRISYVFLWTLSVFLDMVDFGSSTSSVSFTTVLTYTYTDHTAKLKYVCDFKPNTILLVTRDTCFAKAQVYKNRELTRGSYPPSPVVCGL